MPLLLYRLSVIVVVLCCNVALSCAQTHGAIVQDQAAVAFIQSIATQGLQTLHSPEPQRIAAFRQLFEANFDIPAMSSFALGPYIHSFDQRQRTEYMALFRQHAVMSIIEKLSNYGNMIFRATGSRPYGSDILVTGQAVRGGGQPPIEVDWVVRNSNTRYLVSDVFIDGVSMKLTYRDGFAGVIERNGGRPEAILAALRQMTGQGWYQTPTPHS